MKLLIFFSTDSWHRIPDGENILALLSNFYNTFNVPLGVLLHIFNTLNDHSNTLGNNFIFILHMRIQRNEEVKWHPLSLMDSKLKKPEFKLSLIQNSDFFNSLLIALNYHKTMHKRTLGKKWKILASKKFHLIPSGCEIKGNIQIIHWDGIL